MSSDSLIISGPAASWEAAGFSFETGRATPFIPLGNFGIELVEAPGNPHVVGLSLSAPNDVVDLDGIPLLAALKADELSSGKPLGLNHPNEVSSVDHLVISTPNHERTRSACIAAGLEHRKSVGDPRGGNLAQSFFWANEMVVELVGPYIEDAEGAAAVWGISLVSEDLAASHRYLGKKCSEPKKAMQPGRRIAVLDTSALDIPLRISFMSPRPSKG